MNNNNYLGIMLPIKLVPRHILTVLTTNTKTVNYNKHNCLELKEVNDTECIVYDGKYNSSWYILDLDYHFELIVEDI